MKKSNKVSKILMERILIHTAHDDGVICKEKYQTFHRIFEILDNASNLTVGLEFIRSCCIASLMSIDSGELISGSMSLYGMDKFIRNILYKSLK